MPASDAPLAPHGTTDPLTASAPASGWAAWLRHLLSSGWDRLVALGLSLALGFGAGIASLYLLAKVANDVLERETQALDEGVLAWLRQFSSPSLDYAARGVTMLGSEALAGFLVLLLIYLAVHRRWGAAAALLLVTGGAQLLNNVLKDLFHRTRPGAVVAIIPSQQFSFPSGHAMVSTAFYLFIAYLAWRLLRGWRRHAAVGVLLLVVGLIGLSRLYLGVHYLTDVVAGYLAGFLWTDAVILGGFLLGRGRRLPPARREPRQRQVGAVEAT